MKKKFPQIFKILLLFCFISMNAQTINYDPPGFYVRGQPISTLVPNQSGITIQGGTYRDVSLFAGTGSSGGTNASSSSTSSFQNPRGIVKDRSGNYYIAEVQGKRIRKISATGVVTTVHQFTDFEPRDLVINSNNGDLYAVIHTHRIIRIPNTNWANYPLQEPTYVYTSDAVNVIAGSVSSGYTDATGTAARFNNPWGLAIASDNTYLLVSDFGNNRIRKVMLSNFAVSTFVPSATFSGPTDVHIVNNDLIYVAEFNGNRIQKISGGSSVSLFVSGTFGGGNFDGTGATGFIDQPHSLTADGMGNVYVVERMNHKVRKITPQGKITTIAGTLWNTDNSGNQIGTGSNARFRFPTGIFYDIEGGFLLIADTDNHQLKKVQLSGFEVLPPLPTGLSLNTSTGVISGTPTAVSLQNVYQNNFNTSQLQFLAGETVTLADNAAVIGDYLQLTPRQNNSKGGITIQPFESNGFGALKVSFDLITTKTSADNTSADGFSYSFAPDASATATSPQAEIGTGTKLAVSFATFGSNRGIRIFYNPASNQSLGTTLNSVLLAYTNNTSWMGKSVKVVLDVTDMGDLTLTIDGVTIFTTTLPANFSNSDKSTWKHVFKARTGLSNDLHAIDNLSLQLRNGPTRHTVVGRDYNNEVESTFLINSSVLPTVSTQSVTSIQYTQATVNYQILGPGSSSLSNSGFVWSTTPSPTIFDNAVIHPSPAVVGNQSLAFDDLLSSTTYYVRAVVINEWGVYAYGQELSFTTLAYTAPTVSTNGTTAVTQTTAVSGGDVTNDGGNTLVERGICWSTNPNPTIADQKIVDSAPSVGTFTSSITGLVAGTVYYIRAYATNSVGTTYGSEQSFMTIPTVPIITYQEENYLAQNFLGSPIVPTITGGSVTQGLSGVSTIVTSFPSNSSKQFALSHDNNFFYYASINTIYKINRATNVTTILAGGTTGSNDGIGTAAQFEVAIGMGFSSIAVNKTTGNIYVLSGNEQQSARLRQITPDGVVSTIANIIDGSLGYPNGPTAVDGMGNIFYINNGKAIGKIPCINNSASPTFGTPIPNWAGTMFSQLNVDGTGDSARFRQITSKIAIDASNNLYVVDLRLIRKISPTAVVTTIAGNLNSTTGANGLSIDGNGTSAYFTNYASYTYSPLDNSLYGIDMGTSHFIRKIDLSTLNVTTLYQTNVFSGAGFTMEMLNGDLYGILYGGEAISKTTVFGYSVSPSLPAGLSLTVTGEITGTPTVLSPLTTYTIKSINPYHIVNATTKIVVEPFTTSSPITSDQTFCSGALVSDLLATGTYLQWYTALTGGIAIPTTTALATGTYYLEQIIAASVVDIGSDFNFPSGVAIQADGKIVIVDSGNNTIKRMNADGSNIETLGSGFSSPKDVVIQADGKIVIVDTGNDAIKRMNADGTNIETLGTGFASPYGVAIQADGKIVVADSNNNAIKRMNADGTNVETLGSGFSNPTGVAIQADGKIVVADAANNAINRMNSDGTNIETLGSGFSLPTGVAIQADGKIVVADADNSAIKRMNVDGTNIETLGNGFSFPYAVAIQSDGKIVVVDLLDHTIKRITEASSNRVPVNVTVNNTEAPTASAQSFSTSGTVSDLVAIGTALQWYAASTGGTALPTTTALETGTYYVSQTIAGCESLRTAVAVTVNVTTAPIASAQTFCTSGTVADLVATGTDLQWYTSLTGGTAIPTTTALATGTYYVEQSTAASVVTLGSSFNFPSGAAIQADGKIVVADQGNNAIKRMNVDGTNIETLGSGFNSPYGVAIQSDGKIVVADKGNNAIKRMNADGSNIETLGTGFASPYGVTIQADGKIVVADSQNNAIKRMNADGSNIVTLGSGFSFPFGVAIQADGKIVVSVPFNNAIKRMDADGTNVETLGSGFSFPSGVAIQADGKIVLADQGNMAIKRMNVDGTNIETLGTGFSFPYGVAIQGDGKIVVADFNNNAIKRITEASSTNRVPVNVTVNNTEAPTASAQSFSTSGTVSDLVAIGTALQWYAASTGSTALPTTTALSSGMYYVSQTLNSCESPRTAVAVTVNVTTAPTASDQILCQGATVSDLVAVGTTLQWYTVAEGGVALGTTTILSTGTYYVSQTVSGVESDRTAVTVTIVPSLGNISWISGPSVLSAESTVATYSVTAVSGATSYVWNLPSGLTLTSQTGPTVTVAVASNFTNGDLSVYALNSCGETVVRNVFVTKAVALPGGISFAITGSSIICANTVETYSATAVLGGSYIWSVPAGVTITSGQGTNSITVSVGGTFVSGQVGATCVTSDYTFQDSYLVSGSIQPSTITGPVNLCSLSTATYSVATIPGVSYLWSVPLGMSIISGEGTSSITVSISASSSGSISVRTQSLCGLSAPSVLSVNTAPVLGRITGITRVCGAVQTTVDSNGVIVDNTALNSYTYRVAPVAGVSSYIWTVPSGVIIESGQGTNALTVSYDLSTFTTGTLTVQGVNSCGTGSLRSLVVSVVSGTITGPTSLCSMTTASYSIPSDLGNNFVWSLPQGMSIISGTGTSSITVSLSHPINFATSNQVRVTFTTACGGEQTLSLPVNCSAYTSLSSGHCGATSVSPMQWLDAMTVSGANGYRFNIYDASGTALITSIDRPFHFFRFSQMNFEYGTTYQVRVQLKQGEVYGSEGATCSVTLMTLPTTTLAPSVCGATGVSPSQWLDAIAVSGASGYRFNIYESTGTTLLSSIDRSVSFFRLSQMSFTYGVTYQVKVQVKQGDVYGLEGASCSVSTVAISTTTLAPSVCGATGVSPSQWLDAIAVFGASGYRFNIYEATGTTLLASIDRPVSFFRFLQMNFEYGATYQVKVQVKQGEVYGAEGSACSVTTISLPVTSLSATVCGATNISPSQWLDAIAVSGASGYRFNIYEATGTTLITSIDRPVSFFRFSQMDFEYGTAYQVGVQVKQGDIYGLEGKQCRIVVANDEFSRQTSMDDDESTQLGTPSSPLVLVAYPNPFSTSFMLRPLEGVDSSVTYQVYDITGKLLESRAVNSSEIGTHAIGENYPSGMYLVIATQGDTRQTFKMIKR